MKELLIAILLLWLQIASLQGLGEVHEIQALTNPILVQQSLIHSFALRDYQQAIDSILEASESGVKRQAIEMATGSGKTVVSVI